MWIHLPLLVRSSNKKLSKRDKVSDIPFLLDVWTAFDRLNFFKKILRTAIPGICSSYFKDAFVDFYDIEKGYLPIAVLNYLCRNGSGIRDFDASHLYTLEEMIENFDVNLIGKRNIMVRSVHKF